jgi:Protein of unknown function (DUF 659)/hAT family C-terminal dimerisation region
MGKTPSLEWAFVDIVHIDGSVAPAGAVGRAVGGEGSRLNVGDKARCHFCFKCFAAQPRLVRTHLAGETGDVQPCPGVVLRPGETAEELAARKDRFAEAKAACRAALDKTRAAAVTAKEKKAVDSLTKGGSAAGKELKDAPTFLSQPLRAQQRTADEALALGFACAGIAANVLTVPELQAALKEVAKTGVSYAVPSRKRVGGPLLRAVYDKTKVQVARAHAIAEEGGVTVTSDGVTSRQRKPIINIMEVSGGCSVFITAEDCSGHIKDGQFIADIIINHINSKKDPRSVVAVCMDNATRSAWPIIEKQCPWVVCHPCTAHVLDLLLEDIGKLPFCKSVFKEANQLRMFLQNKSQAHYVYQQHATHELQSPGATRFRQHFIMLISILKEEAAIYDTMVDKRLRDYVTKNKGQRSKPREGEADDDGGTTLKQRYDTLKDWADSSEWWASLKLVVDIMKPMAKFQALVDGNGATASKAYFNFYLCQQAVEALDFTAADDDAEELKQNVVYLINKRWQYFESPLTLAGYALDPEFWDCDAGGDDTVMDGLFTMIEKTFAPLPLAPGASDEEEARHAELLTKSTAAQTAAHAQFSQYKNKTGGLFNRDVIIEAVGKMSAYDWWYLYCGGLPELRKVALRVLAQPCSSSSSERLWKDLGEVVNKKRTSMGWDNVMANIYIRHNRRMLNTTQSIDFKIKVIPDSGGYDDDSEEDEEGGDAAGAAAGPSSGEIEEPPRKRRRKAAAESAFAALIAAPPANAPDDSDEDDAAVTPDAWAEARADATVDVDEDIGAAATASARAGARYDKMRVAASRRRAPVAEDLGMRESRRVRRPARLDDCVC